VLIGNLERFDSEADVYLGSFPNVEKGFLFRTDANPDSDI